MNLKQEALSISQNIIQNLVKHIKKNKVRIPKNCILCECWIFFKVPLCKDCRKFLYHQYKMNFDKKLNILNHHCFYLWEWNLQSEYWVQKIIINLKDGYNFELYKLFMSWLIKKSGPVKKSFLITAIPSSHRSHPEVLIKSVKFHHPKLNQIILIKKDLRTQKNKSRFERLQTDFSISEKTLKIQNIFNRKVIVFDDVLSTGGSFLGVKKALKGSQLEFIAVWAYRPFVNTNKGTNRKSDCFIDNDLTTQMAGQKDNQSAIRRGHEIDIGDKFNFK